MSVVEGSVVGTPVRHDAVHVGEGTFAGEVGHKPGGGPGGISTLIENIVDLCGEFTGVSFSDLDHRTQSLDEVHTAQSDGHTALADEVGGETAAAEIFNTGRTPLGGIKTFLCFVLRDLPEGFHHRLAVTGALTGCIQSGGTGVQQMDQTGNRQIIAGDTFDRFLAPEGTDIGESGSSTGEQVSEKHHDTVESIVFCGDHHGFTDAVPVKGAAEHGFGEVAVGEVVGPLTLPLEAAGNGVVSVAFFAESHFSKAGIALHQVADDHCHLDDKLPLTVKLLAAVADLFRIVVSTFLAVGFDPGKSFLKLFLVINALFHAADDLRAVHRFTAHVEVIFKKFRIDDGTGNTHGDAAH